MRTRSAVPRTKYECKELYNTLLFHKTEIYSLRYLLISVFSTLYYNIIHASYKFFIVLYNAYTLRYVKHAMLRGITYLVNIAFLKI